MSTDLTITKIHNTYRTENYQNWHRDFFDTRKLDAIVFFTEGEIIYHFENKDVIAKKGDILLLPGNLPYSGKKITNSVSYFAIDFSCLNNYDFEKFGAPLAIACKNFGSLVAQTYNIEQIWNNHLLNSSLEVKSFVYSLLSEICKREENLKGTTSTDNILDYISKNISNCKLSLKEICNEFYISESQLRRNIHKLTGLSPNEYITTLRINKAKNELSYTNKSIQIISSECGFTSQFYFSKVFSKSTGTSPSRYRTQIQN